MSIVADQLGQVRVTGSDTTAQTLCAPPADEEWTILFITVVNTTANNDDVTLYNDQNGTTADATTQFSHALQVGDLSSFTYAIRCFLLGSAGGTLRFICGTGDGITVTAWGLKRT